MTEAHIYPLQVERKFVYRMWGRQRIAQWLDLPEPHQPNIGETWEVYDENIICNGSLAGQTLAQATQQLSTKLIGTRAFARYGIDFPLLIKFIDANDKLSIQVHPNDEYAHAYESHTGFHGKAEAWYILDAKPDANIIYGLKEAMSREQFAAAIAANNLEWYVQHVPLTNGDIIYTPPGTLHAINDGLLIYEVQQKSDLTYRVYDYGRRDPSTGETRTLHLDKALDLLSYKPPEQQKVVPIPLDVDRERTLMLATLHFVLEHWNLTTERHISPTLATMEIITCIRGAGKMTWEGIDYPFSMGDSIILPASLSKVALLPITQPCEILRAFIPDLYGETIPMLQGRGCTCEQIAQVVFHE